MELRKYAPALGVGEPTTKAITDIILKDARAPCDGVSGGLGSLMHLKQKHPHLQVVLSIGGSQSSHIFPTMASSAASRDNFARSARGLVEASGLDGIDLCWECPHDPQQGANFLALLAAIRIHLPEEHFLLTAALPASRAILQNVDCRRAADYLDHLNLMAYDFCGPWSPKCGHHAQLYPTGKDETSGSTAVSHLISHGMPARKILLGIPLHGRSFLNTSGPGHKFKGTGGTDGSFDYNQLPRKGAKEHMDKKACAAYCMGGDGGFISYDNPDSVKHKAAFCKQKGLGVSSLHAYARPPLFFIFLVLCPRLHMADDFPRIGAVLLVGSCRFEGQQAKFSCSWVSSIA